MFPVRVVIFAKAPIEGFAKTRLIPALGKHGAVTLARRMLEQTVSQAVSAQLGPVELCITPDSGFSLRKYIESDSVICSPQGTGDLGTRLERAARRCYFRGEPHLIIGTDCPALNQNLLRKAAAALRDWDSCMIPAADGGYVLLGLRHYSSFVFSGIPWSTGDVARITRMRIQSLGWSCKQFPFLHDIDEPTDLKWLPADWHIRCCQ